MSVSFSNTRNNPRLEKKTIFNTHMGILCEFVAVGKVVGGEGAIVIE